jgi:hypothetical protein
MLGDLPQSKLERDPGAEVIHRLSPVSEKPLSARYWHAANGICRCSETKLPRAVAKLYNAFVATKLAVESFSKGPGATVTQ